MPAHIIVTIAILFGCMIACYFSASRGVSQIRKGDKPSIVVSLVIPFVNIFLVCNIFMLYLTLMPSSRGNETVFWLSALAFTLSVVTRMYFIAEEKHSNAKYFVNGLNGISSSVMCERETENQALWEACQLAKQHNDMVFTVTDTRGRKLAIVNHADVSIQMLKSKFGL